jgi:hypothetical protein
MNGRWTERYAGPLATGRAGVRSGSGKPLHGGKHGAGKDQWILFQPEFLGRLQMICDERWTTRTFAEYRESKLPWERS